MSKEFEMFPKREVDAEDSRDARASKRDVHADDVLLRKRGYRIKFRRKGQEPIWEKGGVEFKQSDALFRCRPAADEVEVVTK
jgi:hypothetical protein